MLASGGLRWRQEHAGGSEATAAALRVLRSKALLGRDVGGRLEVLPQGPCKDFPWFAFKEVLHSNLGGKGPDRGAEELILRMVDRHTEDEVDLIARAWSSYEPWSVSMNGVQYGKFGSVNLKPGSMLSLGLHFVNTTSQDTVTLPSFALTFFNIIEETAGTSRASITVPELQTYHLTGARSEVHVVPLLNGSTEFVALAPGSGRDSPLDPMLLTTEQQNRAVSLIFREAKEINLTLASTPGNDPRFFTFAAWPSLLCTVTIDQTAIAPGFQLDDVAVLENLKFAPPDEVPVYVDAAERFLRWYVMPGDEVKEGYKLFSTRKWNETTHVYLAPCAGTVRSIQTEALAYELLDLVMDNHAMVVITRQEESTDPDPSPAPAHTTSAPNMSRFRLPPLTVGPEESPTYVPIGSTFVRFLTDTGLSVDTATPVAEVQNEFGRVLEVFTTAKGVVLRRQELLERGTVIDGVTVDCNIMILGKLSPLKVSDHETLVSAPPGMIFVRWHKEIGDIVATGDPICDVRTSVSGSQVTFEARHPGIIVKEQEILRNGSKLDEISDGSMAAVGQLPRLEVAPSEAMIVGPPGQWVFEDWVVKVGDTVNHGDPVALIRHTLSPERTKHVKASKFGKVVRLQDHLSRGDNIEKACPDRELLVIGKFPAMQPCGLRQYTVEAPGAAVFSRYFVRKGDQVQVGDKIAQVIVRDEQRRLASDGSNDTAVESTQTPIQLMFIHSPIWGKVLQEQPLKPGYSIEEQQEGFAIITLDQGPPWWLAVSIIQLMLICTCAGLYGVMEKPQPTYAHVPLEPTTPRVERAEPPRDGLRLDFDDRGTVKTVYAKWRPLGIKHNEQAPIVVRQFSNNSYAKLNLGLQIGWKLIRIGDEDVGNCSDFTSIINDLALQMKDFPVYPLSIDFANDTAPSCTVWFRRREQTTSMTIDFVERPIGIEFSSKLPLRVMKVHPQSPASKNGVREGWRVTRIGDMDLERQTSFHDVDVALQEGVSALDATSDMEALGFSRPDEPSCIRAVVPGLSPRASPRV